MCKSPNLQREFPLPASVQFSRIGRPYSPFPTAPPAPISPPSARHSPQHAISWRCTGAGSMIPKYNANCSASTNECWLSPHNWIESRPPKNEEILAGQVAHPSAVVSFRYTRRNENFVLVTFVAVATTAECWHWALRSNVSANSGLGL